MIDRNDRSRARRYTDKEKKRIKQELCERISEGEPLRAICREEGMPTWRTVYLWREEDKEFDTLIARARHIGFDAIAEDVLLIADTPEIGEIITEKESGREVRREDMLGHRKLKIDARLKLLAKWDPKRYGERVDIVSSDASMSPSKIEIVAPALIDKRKVE